MLLRENNFKEMLIKFSIFASNKFYGFRIFRNIR